MGLGYCSGSARNGEGVPHYTKIVAGWFIGWLDNIASQFYDWRERYGKANEHNGWVPRDVWLENWENQAIIDFHLKNPL